MWPRPRGPWGVGAFGLALAACGPEVPAPRPPQARLHELAPVTTTPVPTAVAPPAPSAVAGRRFDLAWAVDLGAHNRGVLIAPWGDVVALGSRKLAVYDRGTGALRLSADTCFTFANAFGFVGPDEGALVCEDGVRIFSFRAGTWGALRAVPGQARAAAFGGARVAVVDATGQIRLLETKSWTLERELAGGGPVTALALSPDGQRLAVALADSAFWVDLASPDERHVIVLPPGPPLAAMVFSGDGRLLYVSGGPRAALLDLVDGTTRALRLVEGVATARFLGTREIATAGADGVLVVSLDDGSTRSVGGGVDPRTGRPYAAEGVVHVGLAVDPGGELLCAGEEAGTVACYGAGRIPPGAAFEYPPAHDGTKTTTRVVASEGKRLRVQALPGEPLPVPGGRTKILRYAKRRDGPLEELAWDLVGVGTVESVEKDLVRVTLDEAPSTPLVYDAPVRLVEAR